MEVLENTKTRSFGKHAERKGGIMEVYLWKLYRKFTLENLQCVEKLWRIPCVEDVMFWKTCLEVLTYWKLLCRGKVSAWKLCSLDNLRVLKNNILNGTPEMWRFYGGFMEIL